MLWILDEVLLTFGTLPGLLLGIGIALKCRSLTPEPSWADCNCVSLEGIHTLKAMYVPPGAQHVTFLAT